VIVTHDEQVAGRTRRQLRMLDGSIVSDTAARPGWPRKPEGGTR
jgi:ABC-type lipoprotein export system ATPase subunit